MSPPIRTKTRVEPLVGRSTAPTGVGRETELREFVRAEGEEGHGVDGLIRQS
jgi:hypothetical protein